MGSCFVFTDLCLSLSVCVCVCVRTAKFNTSSMALFFNAHHHRITLASRTLSLQESNQKRHFAFLCLALMMMMTKTILSSMQSHFNPKANPIELRWHALCIVVGHHKTTTNTDNRFVFQVNHRNRFNELIQWNLPLFQWYFCDFLIIWWPLLPCAWSVGRVEPFLLRW